MVGVAFAVALAANGKQYAEQYCHIVTFSSSMVKCERCVACNSSSLSFVDDYKMISEEPNAKKLGTYPSCQRTAC
jgi:hypothetical protein